MTAHFAAVDLGASSGRVMLAEVDGGAVRLREVHRFANRPVAVHGRLCWDILALWAGVQDGLRAALRSAGTLDGIGVDSWAVDYALLDAEGRLLGNPVHYRDRRTDGVADAVAAVLDPADQYARTGIQVLPFNTVYQLVADRESAAYRAASHALLIPDLITYWLTGVTGTERTNASTTGLLDARTGAWCEPAMRALGLRTDLFAPLRAAGQPAGPVVLDGDLRGIPVYTVGSHDTASAVVGVPAASDDVAYISCGTWSLVGVELDAPVTTESARAENFSNEGGVDDTIRLLRNVMGLWLLQECLREWDNPDLQALLAQAADVEPGRFRLDPDRPEFLPPGDMAARIRAECARAGGPVPASRAELVRCILDGLAAAYRRALDTAERLSGRPIRVVHVVGGGSQNALLCQLTADACERTVVAGPVEAAAYGNVLVQARAAGVLRGTLGDLRAVVRESTTTVTYRPRR